MTWQAKRSASGILADIPSAANTTACIPLHAFVQGADPQDPSKEILFAKSLYGEGQADATALNLRGREYQRYDSAGVVTNHRYDFKGNLLSNSRQLVQDYKSQADWSQAPTLEAETFASQATYDALNRVIQAVAPH